MNNKHNSKKELAIGMVILFFTTAASAQTEFMEMAVNTSGHSDWWAIIVKQSPALAILAFIVWTFFKHLEKRDSQLADMGKINQASQEKMSKAMTDVSEALGAYTIAFGRLERVIERLENKEHNWRTPTQ